LAPVCTWADDAEATGLETKARPSPLLFLQAVAEQQRDADRRLRPWKVQVLMQERLLQRAKVGIINTKLSKDVLPPSATRPQFAFASKQSKDAFVSRGAEAVARAKAALASFQSGKAPVPPYMQLPLLVGQVGILEEPAGRTLTVTHVLDKENILARIWFGGRGGKPGGKELVLIRGIASDGAVENGFAATGGKIFQISGATRDGTTAGSPAVLILEPMTEAEWSAFVAEVKD
jgi:hypothetical protein